MASLVQRTIVKIEDMPRDKPIKIVPSGKDVAVDALVVNIIDEGKAPTFNVVRRSPGLEMIEGFLLTDGGLPVLSDNNGERVYSGGNNFYAFPASYIGKGSVHYVEYKQALIDMKMW